MALDLPDDWLACGDRVRCEGRRRIMVLGATDVGKSSFCSFVAAFLAQAAGSLRLLDADLGQKLFGPPACITLARFEQPGRYALERLHFIGDMHPVANGPAVIAGVARLAHGGDLSLVNTSGLISAPAGGRARQPSSSLHHAGSTPGHGPTSPGRGSHPALRCCGRQGRGRRPGADPPERLPPERRHLVAGHPLPRRPNSRRDGHSRGFGYEIATRPLNRFGDRCAAIINQTLTDALLHQRRRRG